jgi:hypothetical protein
MTMSRKDRRSFGDYCIDVYAADTSRGWRITRQTTPAIAYKKVLSGKYREVFDDFGNFFGVQIIAAAKTDLELVSDEDSTTTITARENRLNAGLAGQSHTIGLTEDRRITRQHPVTFAVLPPEDGIERVRAKVNQWPYPASRIDNGRGAPFFGDRAVRVYPRWFK